MLENEIKVVEKMEKYGGSFIQALAQCFYRADPQNFLRLRLTFADYWEQYEKLAFPYNNYASEDRQVDYE